MDILVVDGPRTTAFTTLARMRRELGLTTTAQDDRLTDLIEEVSADIIAFCQQPLIRQSVTERQVGYGRSVQMLSVTPVPRYGVTEVRLRGAVVSGEYPVTNSEAGFVFNQDRWADTRQMDQWIEAEFASMPGNPDYEFDYSGGYILPGDDITASGTCQANSADNSFELTGDTFPILTSGETVRVEGFTESANNGRFTVLSRTPTKLVVAVTLVDEVGDVVTIESRTLPRDLERLCVQEVKYRYMSQRRDPSVKSESLGDWSAQYEGALDISATGGLSAVVAYGLQKYVRVA